jgi:hypothetical protein
MARSSDVAVNPAHYASLGEYAAVIVIREWSRWRCGLGLAPVGFCVGNAVKYIQRAGTKEGESEMRDLEKAVWYLQSRIHELDDTKWDPAA